MEDQRTFREKLIEKTAKFIHENVPVHSRAQYEALLATNTDLAIELIARWRDLEDLKAAHRDLQYETARQTAPLPPMITKMQIDSHPYERETVFKVRWEVDPYQVNFAVSDLDRLRQSPPAIVGAYRRYFHDKFVPELWARTERTLWSNLMKDAVPCSPL